MYDLSHMRKGSENTQCKLLPGGSFFLGGDYRETLDK